MDEISVAEHLRSCVWSRTGAWGAALKPYPLMEHMRLCAIIATETNVKASRLRGCIMGCDSSGQYEGTTDITRTVVMGPVTDESGAFYIGTDQYAAAGGGEILHGRRGISLDHM